MKYNTFPLLCPLKQDADIIDKYMHMTNQELQNTYGYEVEQIIHQRKWKHPISIHHKKHTLTVTLNICLHYDKMDTPMMEIIVTLDNDVLGYTNITQNFPYQDNFFDKYGNTYTLTIQ